MVRHDNEGKLDKWQVPITVKRRMIEIARQFRKEPTPSEAILWQALRNRKLEGRKFRRQQPIGCFIVDFFCADERLIIEVDGLIHQSQQVLDQQRQELLESLGLRFLRLSSELVETNLPVALDNIRQALILPSSPYPFSQHGRRGENISSTGEGKLPD
ncbi:endonuclease domain-containing protein [Pelatocladus sp. BLCC-F211]|uniref:endonuclease domain-containing protein n=1 Tax=Pelatocladus sp. BLCC-F211 TaxID=3342752 RepID=UPI0035B79F73